jgi:hypothetical protein
MRQIREDYKGGRHFGAVGRPAWSLAWTGALLLFVAPMAVQGQFNYITNNGAITITGYTGPGGAVNIPDQIGGLPVTTIGDFAFWDLTNVTSVTIPNSVISLSSGAFAGCALSSVTIGCGVTNIGDSVFDSSGLTSVTIPNSVISIEDYAFNNCTSLTNVTISNGLTRIIGYAFAGCYGLVGVTIPSSVSFLGDGAFSGCYELVGIFFLGNAPGFDPTAFESSDDATVYFLAGTLGWSETFALLPTALWVLPQPLILNQGPGFGVHSNQFGFTISWATNVPVVVQATTNLSNPVWTPVSTNTLTGGTSYFSDAAWPNYHQRFYRLTRP